MKNQVYRLKKTQGFDRSQTRWSIEIDVKLEFLDDGSHVASASMLPFQRSHYYKFNLLFKHQNLTLIPLKKRQKVLKQTRLSYIKAMEIFKYQKIIIITKIKLNYISRL